MVSLSLGQFTAIDVGPVEYISIAADAGFQKVSLLVNSPNPKSEYPLVTRENSSEVKTALQTSGLGVNNIECFMLTPKTDIDRFQPAMALGAELGAGGATAILYDNDEDRVKANLSRLCDIASELGLRVSIEFMAMTSRWNTLPEAAKLIAKMGRRDLGLGIDLLHLIRSGGTPGDVAHLPQHLIHYVQLCDSRDISANRDYGIEAGSNRLAPGEGLFPVQAFLRALPANTLLEVEVPQPPDRPARERVRAIVEASRRQIRLADIT